MKCNKEQYETLITIFNETKNQDLKSQITNLAMYGYCNLLNTEYDAPTDYLQKLQNETKIFKEKLHDNNLIDKNDVKHSKDHQEQFYLIGVNIG